MAPRSTPDAYLRQDASIEMETAYHKRVAWLQARPAWAVKYLFYLFETAGDALRVTGLSLKVACGGA